MSCDDCFALNGLVSSRVVENKASNGIGEGFVQFARFITSLQLDQEPEETELAPCFLAYPTWINAFAISIRALESSIVAGIL
jgi:hypothetical protein